MGGDLLGDAVELGGLVAEHHELGALGDLGVARERLPPGLLGQRDRAGGDRIEAQHRPPPPAGERARHVACSDQSYLHRAPTLLRLAQL